MLPLATLVHNNARNSTTRLVPNQILTGLEPAITPDRAKGGDNPLVEQRINQLRERRILATNALNAAARAQIPDKGLFVKGQNVWLEAKNLALPYGLAKLAP